MAINSKNMSMCSITLLLAISMFSFAFARDNASPPDEFHYDGPNVTLEFAKFLVTCEEVMPNAHCVKQVFGYYYDDQYFVDKECCLELIDMGKECHVALVNIIFSMREFKDDAPLGIPKSKEIWNKCVKLYGGQLAKAPSSFES